MSSKENSLISVIDNSFGKFQKTIIITDSASKTLYVNDHFEEATGYSKAEIIGKDPGEILQGRDTNPKTVKKIAQALSKKESIEIEILNYKKDGSELWIELNIIPELNDKGEVERFLSIQTDITDRIKTEKALARSEKQYRLLTELSSELTSLHNPNGEYTYLSPSVKELLGYHEGELIGKDPNSLIHPEDLDYFRNVHYENLEDIRTKNIEYRIKRKDGSYIWFSSNTDIKYDEQNNIVGLITKSRDITRKKLTELALKRREKQLRNIANSLPGLVLKIKADINFSQIEIVFISDYHKKLTELTKEEIIDNPSKLLRYISNTDIEKAKDLILTSIKSDPKWEIRFTLKDTDNWFHASGTTSIENDEILYLDVVMLNISESKSAEKALIKSEERFRKVSMLAVDYAYSVKLDGDTYKNEWNFGAFKQITGYSVDEMKEAGGLKTLIHPEDQEISKRRLLKLRKGHSSTDEFRIITKEGEVKWIRDTAVPEWDPETKSLSRLLGLAHDITNLKIAENENLELINSLKEALDEKNDLFRELHHRIKNNLQLVSSLLYLKASSTNENSLKEFIQETNLRITSISKIHEQLLKLEKVNTLNIKDYLYDLTQNLLSAYSEHSRHYELAYDIEDHTLNVDTVLTLGLILNEIVSNIIKYAYPDEKEGKIDITFVDKGSHYHFCIKDYGIGLDPQSFQNKKGSLGYQLIKLFTKQINGSLTLESKNGTGYKIDIPK